MAGLLDVQATERKLYSIDDVLFEESYPVDNPSMIEVRRLGLLCKIEPDADMVHFARSRNLALGQYERLSGHTVAIMLSGGLEFYAF